MIKKGLVTNSIFTIPNNRQGIEQNHLFLLNRLLHQKIAAHIATL